MRALVTGSSSGFGELIAKSLAAAGHHVYATMRDVETRNARAAEHARGYGATVVELDVSSDESVARAMDVMLRDGPIDVAVNNAGVSAMGPLEAFSVDQMADLLSLNVLGPMRVNKGVLPGMRAQGSGLIIWITSTLGRVLPGRGGLYPATKWAAEGFAESLHHQVAQFGVDVVILEPGSFPTPAVFKSMPAADKTVAAAYATPSNGPARVADRQGIPEPDPQEVANAVLSMVNTPAGQRPLRLVVGPVFTEGVDEYNRTYERLRASMEELLRRPDQAITWTPNARRQP